MAENYTYPRIERTTVLLQEWTDLKADLGRAIAALRSVLDGMTVQELAALGDLVEQLEERYANEVQAWRLRGRRAAVEEGR